MTVNLQLPSNLTLINATPFTWHKSLDLSSDMMQWSSSFPATVDPGSIVALTLEFRIVDDRPAGSGTSIYSFDNGSTNFDFSFVAATTQATVLAANFIDSSTSGNPPSSTIPLGWAPDSQVGIPFILSGQNDTKSYSSSNPPVDWMHQNLEILGCQPLRRICIPGSHDAGMSTLTHGTPLVTEENTLTHRVDVGGQLEAGFRYFDLRPVISGGEFVSGHYSGFFTQWVGGNGQSLASVIQQINDFTARNKDLVILDVSHTMNTDDGFRLLNDAELKRLTLQLASLNNLYTGREPDLSLVPLRNFISTDSSTIVIWRDPRPSLPPDAPPGIFPGVALPIYNDFSGTDDAEKMKQDQMAKLADRRKTPGDQMFLLSWTLSTLADIRKLARKAHELLFEPGKTGFWSSIYQSRTTSYPNIIFIDAVGDPQPSSLAHRSIAALSMAISHVVLQDTPCPAV